MDGQPISRSATASSWRDRDTAWLVTLLLLVGVLRVWLLFNTEVTARDSIGFIRYALKFDRQPWAEVVAAKEQHQHPGFPTAVWLVSRPLRAIWGTTPLVMQRSAQLVSLVAALLLALVMFHLGKRLWDRFVGFAAALIFQFLPGSGHHLSDGVSDGLYLLLITTAILFLVRGMQSGRIREFALAGAVIGLGYLTRPEGLLVIPAFGVVWVLYQVFASTRKRWRPWCGAAAATTLACVLVGSLYVQATGRITTKPGPWMIIERIIEGLFQDDARAPHAPRPLFATIHAAMFAPADNQVEQLQRTLRALILELGQAFHYGGGFLGLWAFVACGSVLARRPEFWLPATVFLIHACVLVLLGMRVSYISERHVLPLVLLGSYPCVIGLVHLCRPFMRSAGAGPRPGFLDAPAVQRACMLVLTVALGICLTRTVQRLHANRAGNHMAGLWLADRVQRGDVVEDEHSWSHFYSGLILTEGDKTPLSTEATPTCYHVITRSHEKGVRERREKLEKSIQQRQGRLVYHWPEHKDAASARIVVYATPRNPKTHPWARAVPANTVSRAH